MWKVSFLAILWNNIWEAGTYDASKVKPPSIDNLIDKVR